MTVSRNAGRAGAPVCFETGAVEGVLVCFALDQEARRALRTRAAGRRGATLRSELDAHWTRLGLRGAVLVYDGGPPRSAPFDGVALRAAAPARRLAATDPLLVANVLARTRSRLLLPELPLDLREGVLARALWSDDPRLAAFALRSGVEEIA